MQEANKRQTPIFELARYKSIESDIIREKMADFDESYIKLREQIVEADKNSSNAHYLKRIMCLEEENRKMRNKIRISFPTHIVSYLSICSFIMGTSALLLILRFAYGVFIIDSFYAICGLLISLTLFLTALTAIKDWKDFLNGREQ